MCNRTAVAKAFGMAACPLAFGLFMIGTGFNSSWAESDQASGLKFTSISSDVVVQPVHARPGHAYLSFAKARPAESAPVASRQSQHSAEPTIAQTTTLTHPLNATLTRPLNAILTRPLDAILTRPLNAPCDGADRDGADRWWQPVTVVGPGTRMLAITE
jgi:hypothetical protein